MVNDAWSLYHQEVLTEAINKEQATNCQQCEDLDFNNATYILLGNAVYMILDKNSD